MGLEDGDELTATARRARIYSNCSSGVSCRFGPVVMPELGGRFIVPPEGKKG